MPKTSNWCPLAAFTCRIRWKLASPSRRTRYSRPALWPSVPVCPLSRMISGLIVDVMGNAPGILSARWAGAHGHDKANNALLLAQIEDIPDDKRTARFRCAAALVVPDTETGADVTGGVAADGITVHTTAADGSPAPVHARYAIKSETVELGDMPGRIIREARGVHGFGYDPLFVPDDQPAGRVSTEPDHEGEPLTSAEMTPAEKNAISHRGKALKALVPAIEALLH